MTKILPHFGGGELNLLGVRLKIRRRQKHLKQAEVAGPNSASFLSKVEGGTTLPSLNTLREWSEILETTSGDLLGDLLIWEAAKRTILHGEKCHSYLDHLPNTDKTSFLRDLAKSAASLSIPVPNPPPDPELQYLTALVLIERCHLYEAKELVLTVLSTTRMSLWRIYHLSLLCQIHGDLSEQVEQRVVEAELKELLATLDYHELVQALPEGGSLTIEDLKLLKLVSLKQI